MSTIGAEHILITGASGGIGMALALRYAERGRRLSLSGRNRARMDDVTARCRAKGAHVEAAVIDVRSRQTMAEWIRQADRRQPLDLVIANAGISGGSGGGSGGGCEDCIESAEQTYAIFDVNLGGVLNTVLPAISVMRPRRNGHIAIVSSLAGFLSLPGAPAYAASKAAVKNWGEALNGQLKPDGLCVSIICPGFIRSPMTDANPFAMPFLMSAEKAARIIQKALRRRPLYVVFPWPMALLSRAVSLLPARLRLWLCTRAPRKQKQRSVI